MKIVVEQANEIIKKQPFQSLAVMKSSLHWSSAGFYWIYTKKKLSHLKNAPKPSNSAHVNISDLSKVHLNLPNVISQTGGNYWCIYNGKGKQLKTRIAAEYSDTKGPTGKLALTRCFEEGDFKVKYVVCNTDSFRYSYDETKRDFERAWRLTVGWPILCRA